ncbi:MAG: hypothetical protein K0Q77_106 [Anaerosporomusa subterranea]|jgi:hypothetical protein|nr:hypothetical protein [Anaerosporomusa subterranea]
MLELPITFKVIPVIAAAIIALTPVYDVAKIQKDNSGNIVDKSNDSSTSANDKTSNQTTKIITIREGFKGVLLDGNVFQVPFYQKTTVEKTYVEKELENGQHNSISDKQQSSNSKSISDVPGQQTTIISKVVDGGKAIVSKMWQRLKL